MQVALPGVPVPGNPGNFRQQDLVVSPEFEAIQAAAENPPKISTAAQFQSAGPVGLVTSGLIKPIVVPRPTIVPITQPNVPQPTQPTQLIQSVVVPVVRPNILQPIQPVIVPNAPQPAIVPVVQPIAPVTQPNVSQPSITQPSIVYPQINQPNVVQPPIVPQPSVIYPQINPPPVIPVGNPLNPSVRPVVQTANPVRIVAPTTQVVRTGAVKPTQSTSIQPSVIRGGISSLALSSLNAPNVVQSNASRPNVVRVGTVQPTKVQSNVTQPNFRTVSTVVQTVNPVPAGYSLIQPSLSYYPSRRPADIPERPMTVKPNLKPPSTGISRVRLPTNQTKQTLSPSQSLTNIPTVLTSKAQVTDIKKVLEAIDWDRMAAVISGQPLTGGLRAYTHDELINFARRLGITGALGDKRATANKIYDVAEANGYTFE